MSGLVKNTFMELCVMLGALHTGLQDGTLFEDEPVVSHFTGLRARIEAEAIDLLRKMPERIDAPLPMAMQTRSRALLEAVPETAQAVTIDDGSYATFLTWAQAEDFRLAAARGLRLGPRLQDVLDLAKREPEIGEVIFNEVARSGVLMSGPYPGWARMTKIWNLGEIDQIIRLLTLHVELFPEEMSEALHYRAQSNDAAGAEILFVAGARPTEGKRLVAPDAACLPGGFLDRAKSNHGLMAALHGPSAADLIAEFRRCYVPF